MILGSLFIVKAFNNEGKEIKASLEIDEAHSIFNGHFPGQPVVPGVCMMQAVKELVERHTGKKLTLTEGDNMKFLAVLDPRMNKSIEALVSVNDEDTSFSISATLFAENVTFFKLKAVLTPAI